MSDVKEIVKTLDELNEDTVTKLAAYINNWQGIKVNIAVIGISGAGKSTFINTLRNLRPGDPKAAKVGVKETTIRVEQYPHPRNENLIFWDLPGVGTKSFPRSEYKNKIRFEQYDFFLILSCTRFYENDIWLAQEIEKANKKFYFVRTKVDIDVTNAKRDGSTENETLVSIRMDCRDNLKNMKTSNPKVFLIAGYDSKAYDFDALATDLIEGAPELQKKALTLTLFSWSNLQLLKQKRDILQKRIHWTSIRASAPILLPFIGTSISNSVLADEANFHLKEFGLDYESIRKVALRMEVPILDLRRALSLKTQGKSISPGDIALTIATLPVGGPAKIVANVAKNTAAAVTGYFRCRKVLEKSLDEAFSDAYEIHAAFMQRASKL